MADMIKGINGGGTCETVESWCGSVWTEFQLSLKYILDIEINMYSIHLGIRVCESGECPPEKNKEELR